jgi:hypothetical protein
MCFDPALTIPQSECFTLFELYNATNGDDWINGSAENGNTNDRFSTPDVDEWFGINTTTINGQEHVLELLLHRNDITSLQD